ncbi:PREDICTED: U3 small nucleolar ribonucleoprotein protein IMP3 [Cyprinodon variegatus]|uniref:U3 small nucleolar ribonucleoprotein protein IMP3 n=1 Tax=Cyprinodon variegatus TaxID=28743 RepID=UPI000742A6EB|nr:PREDICTED: U3 small nucleolar ribonucleoprotein protein IMP3 [Cyprinodon variegatus]
MVRKLKFHEQKLLKKVDFINWEVDNNLHEVKVLRRYHIERREDYTKYNKLSRNIRDVAQKIRDLDEKDGFRAQSTHRLLEKLYSIGLIPTRQNLSLTEKVSASAFCRRRLPSIMLKLRMAQNLKTAITFIEQGRILLTKLIIWDFNLLFFRNMEDFVTWVDSSKIKQHVLNYNDERDDFDLIA